MGDDVVVDHDVGSDLVELLVPPGVAASFELASPVAGDALQDLYVGDLPPVDVARRLCSDALPTTSRLGDPRRATGPAAGRPRSWCSSARASGCRRERLARRLVRAVRVDGRPLGPGVVDAALDDAGRAGLRVPRTAPPHPRAAGPRPPSDGDRSATPRSSVRVAWPSTASCDGSTSLARTVPHASPSTRSP